MKTSIFYLPSIGSKKEVERGNVGLRGDLYSRMLKELSEQARLADDLGYDSISFTEHHFHIEGMELSNNPVMLDLFVGMQTKNIRVGQLGIVLPAENPVRVAENIAMLDHMTGGRANAGFARGYQRRWVDVMAQQTHGISSALPGQRSEVDDINREAFEECFTIIKKCWTEDFMEFKGKYWNIPVDGIPWNVELTDNYGSGVENGIVKQVAVVPKPVQKPHPPLFQPFAASERSIRWCAQNDVVAILPPMHKKYEMELFELSAEASGRPLGDGIGVLRDVIIADSDDEAMKMWEITGRFVADAWFRPFGFRARLFDPVTGEFPSADELLKEGYVLCGTVDTVCRQLETLKKRIPLNWLYNHTFVSLMPHDQVLRTIEDFATKVLPRVGGTTP